MVFLHPVFEVEDTAVKREIARIQVAQADLRSEFADDDIDAQQRSDAANDR